MTAPPPAKRQRGSAAPSPPTPLSNQAAIGQLSLAAAHQLIFDLQTPSNASIISTFLANPNNRAPARAETPPVDFGRQIARVERALERAEDHRSIWQGAGDASSEIGVAISEILADCEKSDQAKVRDTGASAIAQIGSHIVGSDACRWTLIEMGIEDTLAGALEDLAAQMRDRKEDRSGVIGACGELSSDFSEYGSDAFEDLESQLEQEDEEDAEEEQDEERDDDEEGDNSEDGY